MRITFEPAIASRMERRIHHTAYVENLTPRRWSNFSTARTSPTLPSWTRSANGTPLPRYVLATACTSLRLRSIIVCLASRSPRSIRLASRISSAADSSRAPWGWSSVTLTEHPPLRHRGQSAGRGYTLGAVSRRADEPGQRRGRLLVAPEEL